MADNAELQAKIAALAGRINRAKASDTVAAQPISQQPYYASGMDYRTLKKEHVLNQSKGYGRGGYNTWIPQRGTPYGVARGRGARPIVRNRTLVINGPGSVSTSGASTPAASAADAGETSTSGWVSKRERHMQLINNAVYEQKTQQRTKAMEETRKQKLHDKEQFERLKLQNHLRHIASTQHQDITSSANASTLAHHIFVHGIKFIVTDGGSKLIKDSGKYIDFAVFH